MVDHTERKHAVWSPSASDRQWACPGSVSLAADAPRTTNKDAARGTVGHEIAQKCIEAGELPSRDLDGRIVKKDGFDIEIDEELLDGVEMFVSYCLGLIHEDTEHVVEAKVSLADMGLPIDVFGTCDFGLLDKRSHTLHSIDLKNGYQYVSAKGNRQVRTYSGGLLARFLKEGHRVDKVIVTIAQPMAHIPISAEELSILEMVEWLSELEVAVSLAAQAQSDLSVLPWEEWAAEWLHPGSHCQYCPAAVSCPALRGKALQHVKTNLSNLPPEAIAELLEQANFASNFSRAVYARGLALAQNNAPPPGWMLAETVGHRKFINPAAAVARIKAVAAENGAPVEDEKLYKKELKSPAQAEKLLPASVRADVMKELTTKPITGVKLTRVAEGKTPAQSNIDKWFEG